MSVESLVLILIVVDNGLVLEMKLINDIDYEVLILIVVDNGLVLGILGLQVLPDTGLNPYCSGQWSRTKCKRHTSSTEHLVLILIVVDNGLVPLRQVSMGAAAVVLILIVVDNGLVLAKKASPLPSMPCLNPYCSGQWSRTFS